MITADASGGLLFIHSNSNTIGSGTFYITTDISGLIFGDLQPNTNINIFLENQTMDDHTITFPLTSGDSVPYNIYINVPSVITITAQSVNTMNVFLDENRNVFLNVIFDPRVPIIGVITAVDDPNVANQLDITTNNNTLGSANYTLSQDINAFVFGSLVPNTNINIFIYTPPDPEPPRFPPPPSKYITFPSQSVDGYSIATNQEINTPIEIAKGGLSLMNILYDQQDSVVYITFNQYNSLRIIPP
jgi:hypothetical protein